MSNTTDHIYLLGPADEIAGRASWGNNNAFNPGLAQPVLDGQSYERKNSYFDTDTADDWSSLSMAPQPLSARHRSLRMCRSLRA